MQHPSCLHDYGRLFSEDVAGENLIWRRLILWEAGRKFKKEVT
ncbi:MAG TPA: hypothetical protein VMD27_02980 [Candidatus Aquilonibacter sp.]|nr:hypothetical protein [Candidatus Aquilonibacter sp.]